MNDDQDDIYILELAIDDLLKDKVSDREQRLRSQTIDTLVSRELKEEQALTGFAKLRQNMYNHALSVGVASGVSGLVGYLHDESVAEYAVKGGLVALTSAAVFYGISKVIKHFKNSPEKSDEEKRAEKVKEHLKLLNARESYQKDTLARKVVAVGVTSVLTGLIGGVFVVAPYAALASLYGLGAATGLAAGTTLTGITAARVYHSQKQKLDQYDLERARIVGAELFK